MKLSDVERLTHYFYREPEVSVAMLLKESKMTEAETTDYLKKVLAVAEQTSKWTTAHLEEVFHAFQQQLGIKPRPAFMTIRLALTSEAATPPLFDVMEVLGKETVTKRLLKAIDKTGKSTA